MHPMFYPPPKYLLSKSVFKYLLSLFALLCLSSYPRTIMPNLFEYHMTFLKCHLIFEALETLLGTDSLFLLCVPLAFSLGQRLLPCIVITVILH